MSEVCPRQNDIECCVRCVTILRQPVKAEAFFEKGRWWWLCADKAACSARLAVKGEEHQSWVASRKAHLKPGEKLLVVQDHFGARYGYGNYLVTVKAGEDAQAVWAAMKAADKEDALVLSQTLDFCPESE